MKQGTRIRTRFGVTIPPWRKVDRGTPVILNFVLTGTIPSKKNKQRASFNHKWVFGQVKKFLRETEGNPTSAQTVKFIWDLVKNIRPFIFKPPDVVKWEEETLPIIIEQAAANRLNKSGEVSYPLTEFEITTKYYWADEHGRDTIGKDEAIYDIFVKAGIFADDDYKNLFRSKSEALCYKDRIVDHIADIYVTAYKW